MKITWLGHASVKIRTGDKRVYVDPYVLPKNPEKADCVLITHSHHDHCANVEQLRKKETRVYATKNCKKKISGQTNTIKPGGSFECHGLSVECVHAYNKGKKYHPRGEGVGFVISSEGKKVYLAGDTDFIPEMKRLKGVDVAFLPIGGTYTMGLEEAGKAANAFRPGLVVPYHYDYLEGLGVREPERLKRLVECDVRVLGVGEVLEV